VKTLPLLSLLSPVPLSHPELSAQQPRLSFPITDYYFYYYYEVVAQRARLIIPVPAVE
jgi:hypothetical protein